MKASNATSARATTAPRHTGRSSAKPRRTPTSAEGIALTGPSDLPSPEFHAYRKDLADVALAGRVIASHYAEPLNRLVTHEAPLRAAPSEEADVIETIEPGQPFAMLDDSLGWAWGYAGAEERVGYVQTVALSQ